jgi:hypothetical protein
VNVEQICWLREKLVTDADGQERVVMEVSFDNGFGRTPQFFRVPTQDHDKARSLYAAWGGVRAQGYRIGTVAKGPGKPAVPNSYAWRKNGNH